MNEVCKTFAILLLIPFIATAIVSFCILYVCLSQYNTGLLINNTTTPSGKIGTVSYTISTPITPLATTREGFEYTLIKPTSSYTRVFLGTFKGFDSSTFGLKTISYTTSTNLALNSGRPYNFKHLPRFRRPSATWISGELVSQTYV